MTRRPTTPARRILSLLSLALVVVLLVACPTTPVNHAPQANDQTVTTSEDTPIAITLDITDEDGDDLTCIITQEPEHGALTGTAPDLTYTPHTDFAGNDIFTYTASDGDLTSTEATVTVTITPSNDAPVAHDETVSTGEDTPVTITLTATDPDGDELTYAIVETPEHGTLTGTPPDMTYTPASNYTGSDAFTFTANDDELTSTPATVTIDVGSANDDPTNLALDNTTVPENAAPPADVGTLTTTDPDQTTGHTYTLTPGPGDDENSDFAITGDTLQTAAVFDHETTPNRNVRIRTTDAHGAYLERTFTITITNVNEHPTSITLHPNSIPENEPAGTLVGALVTSDPDNGDTHTYSLAGGSGDDDNHRFTLTDNELSSGESFDHEITPTLSIRVHSQDQDGLGIEQAIGITVTDVDEPGSEVWSHVFGTLYDDDAADLDVDSAGRVAVAGGTKGGLAGPVGGISDAYVRVYEPDGSIAWTRQFGTGAEDFATDVAVDGSDAIIVVGHTRGDLAPGGSGETDGDAFARKYDASGNVLWTRQFGTVAEDSAAAVAVGSGSTIVVAGNTRGSLGGPHAGGEDAFLRKYDAGGALLWTVQYGGASADFANDVAVGYMDAVFVVGSTSTGAPSYDADAVLHAFTSSGVPGWSEQFGSAGSDVATGVAVDESLPTGGRIVVVGHTTGDIAGSQGNADAFVRKFAPGGSVLWTRQFGSGYFDAARSLAIGPDDEVVVVGTTSGVVEGSTEGGAFARKYSASGTEIWTRQFGSGLEMYIPLDEARGVAVDVSGYVLIAGNTHGELGASPSTFEPDAFVQKRSP